MHHFLPFARVVLFDGQALAKDRRIVDQPVEPAKVPSSILSASASYSSPVGSGQVQNGDRRSQCAVQRLDIIVDGFQFAGIPTVQT